MRIVYSVDSYHPMTNGIITCVDSSIRYLVEQGHEVILLIPDYKSDELSPVENLIKVIKLPTWPIWFTTNKHEKLVSALGYNFVKKVLDEFKPDLIHVHLELVGGFLLRKYSLKNKIPMVSTAHTRFTPYMKLYIPWIPGFFWDWFVPAASRFYFDSIAEAITPSQEMANLLTDEYKLKIPVTVVPNGIDKHDFEKVDKAYEREHSKYFDLYPRIKNRKRLLYVGRVSEEKNIRFLFKVLKKLLEERNDLELMMVGTSSWLEKYEKEIAEMGISDHVTFMGKIPHSEIGYVYTIADVFTFASLTEVQCTVISEAIFSLVPAVVVNDLGTVMTLPNNRGGFLVSEDVNEFSEKVSLLLSDPVLYAEKVEQAKERQKELDFANVTGKLLDKIYANVIENYKK